MERIKHKKNQLDPIRDLLRRFPSGDKNEYLTTNKKKELVFFRKKGLPSGGKKKSELLDRKKETSPTCSNFEIFDHDPQLDMKFWNP